MAGGEARPADLRAADTQLAAMATLLAVAAAYEVSGNLTRTPLAHVVLIAVLAVLLCPRSIVAFTALGASVALHCFWLMPRVRNHWLLFMVLAIGWSVELLTGLGARLVRAPAGDRAALFLARIAPMLRWAAVFVYLFPALAKMNPDYFDPAISCGGEVYNAFVAGEIPFLPAASTTGTLALAYVGILVEGLLAVCLFSRRACPIALAVGIVFHVALGARVPHIGTFIFALYVLFLPPTSFLALRRASDRLPPRVAPALRIATALFFAMIHIVVSSSEFGSPAFLSTLTLARWTWLAVVTVLGAIAIGHLFRMTTDAPKALPAGAFRPSVVGVIALLLVFANGLAPYVGLKTQLALTMYSNLRTEGPSPNHFFMPIRAMRLFGYEDHLVRVLETNLPDLGARDSHKPAPYFRPNRTGTPYLVPFVQLRLWVDDARRSGKHGIRVRYAEGAEEDDIRDVTHAEDDPLLGSPVGFWAHKFLAFRPVSLGPHQACFW